jgi:hypothetical protein
MCGQHRAFRVICVFSEYECELVIAIEIKTIFFVNNRYNKTLLFETGKGVQ